ncbi:MAG: hypothetical protein ACRD3H_05555 [Terriglobales bacterium]
MASFYSRVVVDIATNTVDERVVCLANYDGPIELAKGADATEKAIADQQSQFYNQLQTNYQTQFAGQSAILKSITDAFTPILNAGPSQQGFSAQELAAMRTQADTGTAQAYQNAKQATGEALAAQGGGNTFLPSATKAGIMANTANQAAAQQAQQQLGITQANYEQGRQNFLSAANVLSGPNGVASMMNPLGYAGSATNAGDSAFSSANTVYQQNKAASQGLWGELGGIAGGIAGSFIGMPGLGAQAGSSLGSALGGSFGGN